VTRGAPAHESCPFRTDLDSRRDMPSRSDLGVPKSHAEWVFWVAGALLFLHAVLAWLLRTPTILTGQDDAAYYLLAQGLRDLRYVDLWIAKEPVHIQYPPGYPALLALLAVVGGDRYDLYLGFNTLCSVATLAIVFWAVARLWRPTVALACLAAVSFNPYFLLMPGELRPEATFAFLAAATLGLTLIENRGWRTAFLIGVSGVVGALFRVPGLALPVAVVLSWVRERKLKAAVILAAVSAGTAGAWFWWTLHAPEQFVGASYGADLAWGRYQDTGSLLPVLLSRIARNLLEYGAAIVPQTLMLPAIPGTPVDNLVIGGTAVVGLGAGMLVFWRRWSAAALFVLGYGAIVAVWPWRSERYLFPLIPLLAAALLGGLHQVVGSMRGRLATPAVLLVAGVMAVQGATQTTGVLRSILRCRSTGTLSTSTCLTPDARDFFAVLEFVGRETPEDAILFTSKPEPAFVYAGRKTVARAAMVAALARDTSASLTPLRDAGVTYVLLAHVASTDQGIFREIERRCSLVTVVARFGRRTYLFAVGRESATAAPDGCSALDEYRRNATDPGSGQFAPYFRSWPPSDFHPPAAQDDSRAS